jgi:hypothetical protein
MKALVGVTTRADDDFEIVSMTRGRNIEQTAHAVVPGDEEGS